MAVSGARGHGNQTASVPRPRPRPRVLLTVLSNVKGDDIAYGLWTGDIRGNPRYPACCKPCRTLTNPGPACPGGGRPRGPPPAAGGCFSPRRPPVRLGRTPDRVPFAAGEPPGP